MCSDGRHTILHPSVPLRRSWYHSGRRLDQAAYGDVLRPAPTTLYVVLDWRECSIAHADSVGQATRWTDESLVPTKHRSGGMSEARFARNHDIAVHHWFQKIQAHVLDVVQRYPTTRIVVGGPGHTKNAWLASVRDRRILDLADPVTHHTGYTDASQGIRELVSLDSITPTRA